MRARCERTAVERCRVTFGEKADFVSFVPVLSVGVRRSRVIGWVCKSEAAGSNPARSIARKKRFAGTCRCAVPDMTTGVRARCERTGRLLSSEVE